MMLNPILWEAFRDDNKIPGVAIYWTPKAWCIGLSWNPRERVADVHYNYLALHFPFLCLIVSWRYYPV